MIKEYALRCLKNFRNYRQNGPIQMAVLAYIVSTMIPEKEIDLYKEVFFYLNLSFTGLLTRVELL